MPNYTNIESNKNRNGAYIGYASGAVYSIKKVRNYWVASRIDLGRDLRPMNMATKTLREMSAKLHSVA